MDKLLSNSKINDSLPLPDGSMSPENGDVVTFDFRKPSSPIKNSLNLDNELILFES